MSSRWPSPSWYQEGRSTACMLPCRNSWNGRQSGFAELDAEVREQVVVGVPDEVLVQVAEAEHARLIVLASLGRRAPLRWLLGSVAERTAQTAPVPVLVVRGAAGFQAWLRGERPLGVMIGVDLSESARSALEWAAELRHLGACDLTVAHIAWPLEQARAGIPGPVRLDRLHPELEQALLRDVTAFVGESLGDRPARVLARPGLGRLDVHLTELAEAEQADLLVVGISPTSRFEPPMARLGLTRRTAQRPNESCVACQCRLESSNFLGAHRDFSCDFRNIQPGRFGCWPTPSC